MKKSNINVLLVATGILLMLAQESLSQTTGITVDANANMGVGTKTPQQKVHTTGNIRFDGREAYFGENQRLKGDGGASLFWKSNNSNLSTIALQDKEETTYGELYGTEAHFGLANNSGNWAVRWQNDLSRLDLFSGSNVVDLRIQNGIVDIRNNALRADGKVLREADGGWIITYNNTGWRSQTHGGGWFMNDASWIRNYGNKGLYMNTSTIRTDGDIQIGANGANFKVDANGLELGNSSDVGYIDTTGGDLYLNWNEGGETHVGNGAGAYGDIRADNFYNQSDRREKKDIETLKDALSTINELRGVSFTWKKNEKKDIGFIAQEVKEILPELVTVSEITTKNSNTTEETYLVNYSGVIPILVEAIKQQQEQINKLSAEVAQLQQGSEKTTNRSKNATVSKQ